MRLIAVRRVSQYSIGVEVDLVVSGGVRIFAVGGVAGTVSKSFGLSRVLMEVLSDSKAMFRGAMIER